MTSIMNTATSSSSSSSSSSGSIATASKVVGGYPLSVIMDDKKLDEKYLCILCKLVLRDAVQSFCGHRFCRSCVTDSDRIIVCPACENDDQQSQLTLDSIFADRAIVREMSSLKSRCFNDGCDWKNEFRHLAEHVAKCDWLSIECTKCHHRVSKHLMANHQCSGNVTNLCKFECGKQIQQTNAENVSSTLEKHLNENLSEHLQTINNKLRHLERHSELVIQQLNNFQHQTTQLHQQQQQQQPAASSSSSSSSSSLVSSTNLGMMTSSSEEEQQRKLTEMLCIYEGVITVLGRETEKISTDFSRSSQQCVLEQQLLTSLDDKMKLMQRQLMMKDAQIAELELRISSIEQTSYDGCLLWTINEIERRRRDACSGQNTSSLYSSPFYSSRHGYKMCARIYLNGDGMGRGSHISLFFVIMRGQYDALLSWPFQRKVSLMLLDQNGRQHIVDAFRPDPTSSSFRRPTSDMNIASGCPLFAPISSLFNANTDAVYVRDDKMFVKVIVNADEQITTK